MIYIHIPFCQSKCPYCSFGSVVSKNISDYFKALELQIKSLDLSKAQTLYIGGGTPSVVPVKFYEKLLCLLPQNFKEATIEANPNSLDLAWIKGLKALGINRLSIGAQSFDDKKLAFLGRTHNAKQAIKAIETAQKHLDTSFDIIYGTRLDTKKSLDLELKQIKALSPTHLSAYSLQIEPNTPFFKTPNKKKESPKLERYFYDKLQEILPSYEISNFGKKSLHNSGYWEYKDYFGIGAFSVGKTKNNRFYAHKDLENYIKNPLFYTKEPIGTKDKTLEQIFLGLRSFVGFTPKILDKNQTLRLEILLKEKKLFKKGTKVYNFDYFLADELTLFLME